MKISIRMIAPSDRQAVVEMMTQFYSSPAVHTNGSREIFEKDINACLENGPYVEGFVFTSQEQLLGYAMVAKSYSTEFGRSCIWLEDLYILSPFRSCGIGGQFLRFLEKRYPDAVLRLEAEAENTQAMSLYRKRGFQALPYMEMIRFPDKS